MTQSNLPEVSGAVAPPHVAIYRALFSLREQLDYEAKNIVWDEVYEAVEALLLVIQGAHHRAERLRLAIDQACNVLSYADNDDEAADSAFKLLRAAVLASDESRTA